MYIPDYEDIFGSNISEQIYIATLLIEKYLQIEEWK